MPLLRVSLRRDGPSSSLVHLPSAGEGVSYQRSSLSYGKQGIDRVYRPTSRPTSLIGSYGYTAVPLATLLGYTPSMALAREASRSSYYSRHDDIPDTKRQQHSRSWSLPHLSTLSLPASGISPSSTTHVTTPTRIRHTWSTQELNRQRPLTQQPQQQQQQHYGRFRLRSQEEEEEEGDDVEEKLREIHLRARHRPIGVYNSQDHPAAAVYTPHTRSYDLPETPRVEKKRVVDGQRTVTAYTRSSHTGFDDHDYDYDIRGTRWDIGGQTTKTKRMPRYQPHPPPPSLPSPSSVYESIELRPIREARKQDPLPRSLEREEKKGDEGSTMVAPQFTSRLRPRSIVEGNAVRLSCAVSAAPEASVTWYHGDNTIANGGRYHVSVSSLLSKSALF